MACTFDLSVTASIITESSPSLEKDLKADSLIVVVLFNAKKQKLL